MGADGVNVETKHAYLDWMVPSTDLRIRMGLQGLALPMATGMGSPIFDDDVAGIVASYKIDDTFSLTAFWMRPYNAYNNDDEYDGDSTFSNNRSIDDETDMFGLIAPITLDGITITPWGMWANIGDGSGFHAGLFDDSMFWSKPGDSGWINEFEDNSNERTSAWWAGIGIAVDLWDPLTFAIDAMYGHMQAANFNITDQAGTHKDMRVGTEGWFVAANLDYKLDWGTPGIFGWYSTGDDWDDVKDDGMLGRLPVMSNSATFAPTSFGFDGGFGISSDQVLGYSGTGLWGVGIQIADMSFIEDLTHTIRFVYMEGTNDADIIKKSGRSLPFMGDFYLTDKDHAFEVNFDHKYQIYENLAAVLELGYINMDLDRSTWKRNVSTNGHHKTDDAWKAQLSFQYKF